MSSGSLSRTEAGQSQGEHQMLWNNPYTLDVLAEGCGSWRLFVAYRITLSAALSAMVLFKLRRAASPIIIKGIEAFLFQKHF